MDRDNLIDQLFEELHQLVMKYAEKGMSSKDIAHSFLSTSYDITYNFGPKDVDLEDFFVGMAMDCTEKMFKEGDK